VTRPGGVAVHLEEGLTVRVDLEAEFVEALLAHARRWAFAAGKHRVCEQIGDVWMLVKLHLARPTCEEEEEENKRKGG